MPDQRIAIVGCGVIGAGWAARFALCGHDVAVVDPGPDAERVARVVFDSARRAWSDLGLEPGDSEIGSVSHVGSIAAAVEDAAFVQESVPERLELKHDVLAQIDRAAPIDAVVASSTSGLTPTLLQEGLARPERLVVGHPFNPVYLLPVVEVVAGERTAPEFVDAAEDAYRAVGMHPVRVRVEVDAFIADRLMEALWREALWLVHDGVATTAEIDAVMTRGFGLRWAQMGLFETYRVAGGEGGFRHFLAQFGPSLELPWSRLTDTPDLDEELIDRIVAQSDEQAAGRDLRSLERARDRNLVSILRGLEEASWGAGEDVAALRHLLTRRGG